MPGEISEITDAQCKVNTSAGARHCIDCKSVIYIGSKLEEDAYYVSKGFYHHNVCPEPEKPAVAEEKKPRKCPECGDTESIGPSSHKCGNCGQYLGES